MNKLLQALTNLQNRNNEFYYRHDNLYIVLFGDGSGRIEAHDDGYYEVFIEWDTFDEDSIIKQMEEYIV